MFALVLGEGEGRDGGHEHPFEIGLNRPVAGQDRRPPDRRRGEKRGAQLACLFVVAAFEIGKAGRETIPGGLDRLYRIFVVNFPGRLEGRRPVGWSQIAGPDYWKYEGKTLSELRKGGRMTQTVPLPATERESIAFHRKAS